MINPQSNDLGEGYIQKQQFLNEESSDAKIVQDLTVEINPKSNRNESENFDAFGLNWSVLLIHKAFKDQQSKNIEQQGIFLVLKTIDGLREGFSQNFKFKILVHQEKSDPIEININHTFSKQVLVQGSWVILKPQYLNEGNGFVKNGQLHVTNTTFQLPGSQGQVKRKSTGMIRIIGQGTTSYLNSLLQQLFHIPLFRWCVYHMPLDDIKDEDRRSLTTPSNVPATVGVPKKFSIAQALQRLFYDLQTSQDNVSNKELTCSFGWNSDEIYVQHDVQEMNRVLIDNLIQKLLHTPFRGCLNHLLEGRSVTFSRCVDINYESIIENSFLDLSLPVKGHPNLYSSIDQYVEPNVLEGDNEYSVEGLGKYKSLISTHFVHLPPVLYIHLMRQQYDPYYYRVVKVHDYFEFPEELDMNKYMIHLTVLQEEKLKENRIQQRQTKIIAKKQSREDDKDNNKPLLSTEMMNKFQWCLGKDRISLTSDENELSIEEQQIEKRQSSLMNIDANQNKNTSKSSNTNINSNTQQSSQPTEHPNEDNIYVLHSVFVHSGETNEGHYNVYIQPKCDGRWFLFDDQCVKEVDKSDAINNNFGRKPLSQAKQEQITNYYGYSYTRYSNKDIQEAIKIFSAYMLVYIKKSALNSILLDVVEKDMPMYIREALIARREDKTRLTFKIFTDAGLVRKYNSALLASMQALARSKKAGRQLTKQELVKVAAQAVMNAKTKQTGQDVTQQEEEEEEPDIYTWIGNADTTNTEQSADEAEAQENILIKILKTQIFDVSNSVETLSISRQATLLKFREEIQAKTNISTKTMRIWRLLQKEIKDDDGIEVTQENLFYNDDESANDQYKESEMDQDKDQKSENKKDKDDKQKKADLEQKGNTTASSALVKTQSKQYCEVVYVVHIN
ncbi:MAG: putative Ubiquitin carboxyl-terminal hydrolase 12 [Streblomastix strix]|uniref:Putative Ubiquitin carboxyl-terminal hydrolase 12 n=1 Tax=Streblomastix strix TaxID=222440 RepID=A0A5J4VIW0_9EUKA|nr:MAG: putative Ubiquitin carboxyl-terminal hydrolase 12 [Streblomastix strix]